MLRRNSNMVEGRSWEKHCHVESSREYKGHMSGHCCCSCSGRGSCSCCCLSPLLLQSRGTISPVSRCSSSSSSPTAIQRRRPSKTALYFLRQARCCCGCRRPTSRRLHCAANPLSSDPGCGPSAPLTLHPPHSRIRAGDHVVRDARIDRGDYLFLVAWT